MALHGLAYLVTHPNRRKFDYASTDIKAVVKDVEMSAQLGYKVVVSVMDLRGDSALSILTTVAELQGRFSPAVQERCRWDNGKLFFNS